VNIICSGAVPEVWSAENAAIISACAGVGVREGMTPLYWSGLKSHYPCIRDIDPGYDTNNTEIRDKIYGEQKFHLNPVPGIICFLACSITWAMRVSGRNVL
jgi:hypothetical protein